MIVNAGQLPLYRRHVRQHHAERQRLIQPEPDDSGPYAGIVFFQPSDNKQTITVTANASGIIGMVYVPRPCFRIAETGRSKGLSSSTRSWSAATESPARPR